MLTLPPQLDPFVAHGAPVLRTMLDLTVYLVGPTVAELDALCDLYEQVCPPDRLVAFQIDELDAWSPLAAPELTESGRKAAAAGVKRPYLEASRKRIREGRAFSVAFWDRKKIADPEASWSFRCRRLKRQAGDEFYSFARFLVPLATDPAILLQLARGVAETAAFRSGHGGLVSEYDPWWDGTALDEAFARARRFWGVDIDSMSPSLFVTHEAIKGVNWITLVGNPLMGRVEAGLGGVSADSTIQVNKYRHGFVFVAGPQPLVGDRNRNDRSLDPYFRVALALAPLFPTTHPDISSSRFKASGLTTAWIRRFIEPAGW